MRCIPHAARILLVLSSLTVVGAGCSPKNIPDTQILDTDENREILDLIAAYKRALDSRNVDGIMSLVSTKFFENSGTLETNDDYDRAGLQKKLETWLPRLRSIRSEIKVSAIDIDKAQGRVRYSFDMNYLTEGFQGGDNGWKHVDGINEFSLVRESGKWLITRGL